MTLQHAKRDARYFSKKYLTFWYVRLVADNDYQPFAHDSDDDRTVACFYCGDDYE